MSNDQNVTSTEEMETAAAEGAAPEAEASAEGEELDVAALEQVAGGVRRHHHRHHHHHPRPATATTITTTPGTVVNVYGGTVNTQPSTIATTLPTTTTTITQGTLVPRIPGVGIK